MPQRSLPLRRPSRAVAVVQLVLLVVFALASLVALEWLGARIRPVDLGDPLRWLRITEPFDVLVGAAHLLAVVLAWWLVASTALAVLAAATRLPSLLRVSRLVTLPVVARMAETAVAASLLGGNLLGPPPAGAAPASPPVVQPAPADLAHGPGAPPPRAAVNALAAPLAAPAPAVQRRAEAPVAEPARSSAPVQAARPQAAAAGTAAPGTGTLTNAPAPAAELLTVTVRRGDSLWKIAGRELGDAERYPELIEQNPWLSSPRYRGGNLIFPGMRLRLPTSPVAAPTPATSESPPSSPTVTGPPPAAPAVQTRASEPAPAVQTRSPEPAQATTTPGTAPTTAADAAAPSSGAPTPSSRPPSTAAPTAPSTSAPAAPSTAVPATPPSTGHPTTSSPSSTPATTPPASTQPAPTAPPHATTPAPSDPPAPPPTSPPATTAPSTSPPAATPPPDPDRGGSAPSGGPPGAVQRRVEPAPTVQRRQPAPTGPAVQHRQTPATLGNVSPTDAPVDRLAASISADPVDRLAASVSGDPVDRFAVPVAEPAIDRFDGPVVDQATDGPPRPTRGPSTDQLSPVVGTATDPRRGTAPDMAGAAGEPAQLVNRGPFVADDEAAGGAPPAGPPATSRPVAPPAGPATAVSPAPAEKAALFDDAVSAPLLAFGGSVMAASVAGLLTRLRRQQQRHRARGVHLSPPPDRELAAVERELLNQAEPEMLHRVVTTAEVIDTALGRYDLPAVMSLRVTPDELEIIADRPDPLPAPWIEGDGPHRWRLPLPSLLDPAAAGARRSVLVPLGQDRDGAVILVNLAAAGLLGIDGPAERSAHIIRAAALTLATAPWTDVDVVVIDAGTTPTSLGRARFAPDLHAALALAQPHRTLVVAALAPLRDEDRRQLHAATEDGDVLALIPGRGLDPLRSWIIDAGAERLQVGHFPRITPPVLDATSLTHIGRMVDQAAAPAPTSPPLPPPDLPVTPPVPSAPAASTTAAGTGTSADLDIEVLGPRPPVFVRVLGPVTIDGAAEFSRAKSRELAVYLALHPSGISEGQLDEALWPHNAGQVKATTRDSTVSVARRALGGTARFPTASSPAGTKRYQVTGEVGCDWDRFRLLTQPATADRDRLRTAMSLVRGRPFEDTGGRGWGWAETEMHSWHMTEQVADAADQLAEWDLGSGDARTARRVARQGLVVNPWCERLYVRLMEAAAALGDPQGVEQVIDELDRTLELGGDRRSLHPETQAAYERCRRPS